MQQLSDLYEDLVQHLNERESHLPEFCCLPLLSCTMTGCLESGRDMTAGGAKYNAISLPLVGIGTAIDSLLAIRQVVYEEKQMTLAGACEFAAAKLCGAAADAGLSAEPLCKIRR